MKKMLSLAAVAVLAMTMAACGTLGTGTPKSISGSQTASQLNENNNPCNDPGNGSGTYPADC